MRISIIVAVANNNVMGKNNQLPWHLPADLKYFKQITTGHHIIMGRKTFDSMGRILPNRTHIIISRNTEKEIEGALVVDSLEKAFEASIGQEEVFVIGGAEIIKMALPYANKIYLTQIHADISGDVIFPTLDKKEWKETKRTDHQPDEKNLYSYSFIELERKNG